MDTKALRTKVNALAALEDRITYLASHTADPNGHLSEAGKAHVKHLLSHAKKMSLVLRREVAAILV